MVTASSADRVLVIVASTRPSADMRSSKDELYPLIVAEGPPGDLFAGSGQEGSITSDSTHRDGIVTDLDVMPTIAEFLGVDLPAEVDRLADRDHPGASAVRAPRALPGPTPDVRPDRHGRWHLSRDRGAGRDRDPRARAPRAADPSSGLRVGVPLRRRARDRPARRRPSARAHVRDGGSVRRAGDGVRDAGLRAARAPRRPADPGRYRDRRPRVLRRRGDPRAGRPRSPRSSEAPSSTAAASTACRTSSSAS